MKKIFEKYKNKNTIYVILIIGVILMLISGSFSGDESSDSAGSAANSDRYRQELEQSLTNILSEMKGVENVHVMVTLKSSAEPSDTGRASGYILKKNAPASNEFSYDVSGAVIAAKGASDPKVSEKIYYAAKAALGISGSRIAVVEAK